MAVFGGVGIYFVERCLPCPKCRTAHSQYNSSSGQHFRISLNSQRGRLFLCRCFDQGQLFLHVCTNLKNKIQNITR